MHVAHEPVALLRGGIVNPVRAHIDPDRSRLNHLPGDELGLAHRDDKDVGQPCERLDLAGARVADRDRRVAPGAVLQQQRRHGPPDDVGAAHDHRVPTRSVHAAPQQQLLDAVRGRGAETGGISDRDLAHILRMEAVHILRRGDPVQHALRVDLLRQRELDQDTVDPRIGVETVDEREQLGFARLRGQADRLVV